MNDFEYLTIKKPSESLLIIKKSKFISNVFPIKNKEEAEQYLEVLRKKYWDATHNVYAYTIGKNDEVQKFSDDGEPSGTAGKPVLETIKSKGIKNVLVVITRYFGGTLLGAGGLIRAYSESASLGLDKAGIIKVVKCNIYKVIIDYGLLGSVEWEIRKRNIVIKNISYTEDVLLEVCVPISTNIDFPKLILNLTDGNAKINLIKCCYMSIWVFFDDEAIFTGKFLYYLNKTIYYNIEGGKLFGY